MSYPTMENTRWERQQPGYLMPPQNQGAMVRAPTPIPVVVKEEQEKPPPEKWQQPMFCPCENSSVFVYSCLCCCCAMGDVGCLAHKKCLYYPVYCLFGAWPCCIEGVREFMVEKYNLAESDLEPDDFGWCLLKCLGKRLLCVFGVCVVPCFNVAQMRAEVAYRTHGKPTVCPCCCCGCGGGDGPVESANSGDLDYPRVGESSYAATAEEKVPSPIDYPRAGGPMYEMAPAFSSGAPKPLVLDYPRG